MRMGRAVKALVSGSLVMLLLFMQLATAAYACPAAWQALHGAAGMAAMPGCDGDMPRDMDAEAPQLCKAHCQQGTQAVGGGSPADWTPWPLLLAVIDWRHAALAEPSIARAHALAHSAAPPGAMPPGSPPIYLSLLVLRN